MGTPTVRQPIRARYFGTEKAFNPDNPEVYLTPGQLLNVQLWGLVSTVTMTVGEMSKAASSKNYPLNYAVI